MGKGTGANPGGQGQGQQGWQGSGGQGNGGKTGGKGGKGGKSEWDGKTDKYCSWCHIQGHFMRDCKKRAAGAPKATGPCPEPPRRTAASLEKDDDWTEQVRDVGSLVPVYALDWDNLGGEVPARLRLERLAVRIRRHRILHRTCDTVSLCHSL